MNITDLAIKAGGKHVIEMPCEYYKLTDENLTKFAELLQASEPVGYIDGFGNFEKTLENWMKDEPNVKWQPVYTPPQVQASEPVAWRQTIYERSPMHGTEATRYGYSDFQITKSDTPLFASPPNTQQKLDKAIWALKHVKPATRNIDQNAWDTIETALKEIE